MQFVRRTFANREAMQPALRASILQMELSPAEAEVFNIPLEHWRTTDRRQLAGFHPCDAEPVDPMSCSPVDPEHPLLRKLVLFSGPVTKFAADAIVNAANEVALGGHGVDGAIHKGAGPLLRRECATLPCCPCGECIITKGYNLPALYVLHTVGPMGEYPAYLESAYRSVFALSKANKLRTLGMCWVSTGIYGYPLEPAVRIAINETMSFLQDSGDSIDRICFACFKHEERAAAEKAIHEWRRSPAAMALS